MRRTGSRSILFGLLFIGIAVYIVLNVLNIGIGISTWRLVLTLFTLAIFVKGIWTQSISGILFPVAFIGILFAKELGIEAFTPWPILGIVLFLSIGLSMIFKNGWTGHNYKFCNYHRNHSKENGYSEFNNAEGFKDGSEERHNDDIDWRIKVGFGKRIGYVTSQKLQRAYIECGFGELQVYFTEAKMEGESIQVNGEVGFGKVILFFPKAWNVIIVSSEVFGSINEQRHESIPGAPTVYLKMEVGFGAVDIIYC